MHASYLAVAVAVVAASENTLARREALGVGQATSGSQAGAVGERQHAGSTAGAAGAELRARAEKPADT